MFKLFDEEELSAKHFLCDFAGFHGPRLKFFGIHRIKDFDCLINLLKFLKIPFCLDDHNGPNFGPVINLLIYEQYVVATFSLVCPL